MAGRVLAQAIPLLLAASGRFLIATALLLLVAKKYEGGLPRLNHQQIWLTMGLGFSGIFLYNVCFLSALAHMEAGRAALFVALNPVVTVLAAAVFLRERLSAFKWVGIVTAFFGTTIVISRGKPLSMLHDIGQSFGYSEFCMVGAISAWAVYTLIGRFTLKALSPVAATTYAAIWGTAFLSIGGIWELHDVKWQQFTWEVVLSIIYLGALGTALGFTWYYQGIKAIGASRTVVFNNLVPVFGVILAAMLLGESILTSMLAGGMITILGVIITNSHPKIG